MAGSTHIMKLHKQWATILEKIERMPVSEVDARPRKTCYYLYKTKAAIAAAWYPGAEALQILSRVLTQIQQLHIPTCDSMLSLTSLPFAKNAMSVFHAHISQDIAPICAQRSSPSVPVHPNPDTSPVPPSLPHLPPFPSSVHSGSLDLISGISTFNFMEDNGL
ncbi:hypothetical protein BDR05DRAFT_999058 [Suillus weaverae]|nr:hypothetical protein BDR05DRAFT_999058 [Suillus weaverae]